MSQAMDHMPSHSNLAHCVNEAMQSSTYAPQVMQEIQAQQPLQTDSPSNAYNVSYKHIGIKSNKKLIMSNNCFPMISGVDSIAERPGISIEFSNCSDGHGADKAFPAISTATTAASRTIANATATSTTSAAAVAAGKKNVAIAVYVPDDRIKTKYTSLQQSHQMAASIATTPTKEYAESNMFPSAVPQQETSHQLQAVNQQQPLQALGHFEQELSKMTISNMLPIASGNGATASQYVAANTLVIDNLTYSDAVKLQPDATAPPTNVQVPDNLVSAATPASTGPQPMIETHKPPPVRKISRFQVSVVDPNSVSNSTDTTALIAAQQPPLPNIVAGIQAHQSAVLPPIESPEKQIYSGSASMPSNQSLPNMGNTQSTHTYAQVQSNFQSSPSQIYHQQTHQQQQQQIDTGGNTQQIIASIGSTNVANTTSAAAPLITQQLKSE